MRRLNTTKRRIIVGGFTLVAAPLLVASVASACTQLKNLNANPGSGAAGATITVSGTNYVTAANTGPIEIRLDSRSSAPIATLPVSSINPVGGTMTMSVTIPASAAVGDHTLLAMQFNTSTGALLNGFPVRAGYQVTAAGSRETTADAAPSVAPSTASVAGPSPSAAAVTGAAATAAGTSEAASTGATTASPSAATAASSASAATEPSTGTPATPAAAAATGGGAAQGPIPAETSTPALAAADAPTSAVVTSGLMSTVVERSTSGLPVLMLAFGAALVLLSLAASLRSGRSVLTGRRPGPLA